MMGNQTGLKIWINNKLSPFEAIQIFWKILMANEIN